MCTQLGYTFPRMFIPPQEMVTSEVKKSHLLH
jgi:hypothetical protein